MRDNLFERLTDLSIGTGSQTPMAAIDRIAELEAKLAKAVEIIEAYGEDEGYIPRRVADIYDEMKGKTDE
jgi:hypothetical protein